MDFDQITHLFETGGRITKIWTYPLAYRKELSKYYGVSPKWKRQWTSPRLRTYLKIRINIVRQFDMAGKDLLDVGSNLGSYMYFIDCNSVDAFDSNNAVILAANEITKVVTRKCSSIQFHCEIPNKHYDYAFLLGPLFHFDGDNYMQRPDGGLFTADDYKKLFKDKDIDNFVFWCRGNRFDDMILKVNPKILHVKNGNTTDIVYVVTKNQLNDM